MAILITQGKQDTSRDNKFTPFEQKDAISQITKLKISERFDKSIDVTLQVLTGPNKNRIVTDTVCYDPASPFSWKYRALRKAAGVPYDESEPATIDIEALLLNKAVLVDYGIRKGKNKDGEEQDYQNVTYKKPKEINTKLADEYKKDEYETNDEISHTIEAEKTFIDESEWDM
jgi:hypothetical protein